MIIGNKLSNKYLIGVLFSRNFQINDFRYNKLMIVSKFQY